MLSTELPSQDLTRIKLKPKMGVKITSRNMRDVKAMKNLRVMRDVIDVRYMRKCDRM